jgi:phenylalanyl-tRNA synthetase beta subunit
MKKSLSQTGTSKALIMSKDMLGLMGLADQDAPQLEVHFYGRVMVVTPEGASERERRIALETARMFDEDREVLMRLAQ